MRVKVGDTWYSAADDDPNPVPIMVELTESDRETIAKMPPDYHYYAAIPTRDEPVDDEERSRIHAWMEEGALFPPGN